MMLLQLLQVWRQQKLRVLLLWQEICLIELIAKLGMKKLSKGVKVEVVEENVTVDLGVNLEYGFSIPETTKKVQKKVKEAIENMTGLHVEDVNVRVAELICSLKMKSNMKLLTYSR